MGQCSTLPSEGRSATSSKKTDAAFLKDESLSHRQRDKYSHRSSTSRRGNALHIHTHSPDAKSSISRNIDNNTVPQTRNPDFYHNVEPMEEDDRDGIPQPPSIATRSRCYKLNLDSDIAKSPTSFLGPFANEAPPLTFSSSSDSSADVSPVQVAIRTANIFRGITVAKDGTILSQNARATRSSRGTKNKRGEKSRQATKIEKAKDLVEETMLTGKAPDSNEPANMMSLVVMGEYDDMKYLVRDGSKKLREASELPDESLLGINRSRGDSPTKMERMSPRKRLSPNYTSGQRASTLQKPVKSRSYSQSVPPKLKGHPRDRPSTRKLEEKARLRESSGYHENVRPGNIEAADWSGFSRGLHSIWNCGGTGEETGTISPTQVISPREAKSHHQYGMAAASPPFRPIFEGRGEATYNPTRDGGNTTRIN